MYKKLIIILLFFGNTWSDDVTIVDNLLSKNTANTINKQPQYYFFFHGEKLSDCLKIFAKANGYNINIDPSITTLNTSVKGRFVADDSRAFLNNFAKQYGFQWFTTEGNLYISSLTQSTSTLEVDSEDMSTLKSHLTQTGLLNSKFSYSELPAQNKIIINGPPEYVKLITDEIKKLNVSPTDEEFAVFRLKYANAGDTQLNYNNQQIILPGIATILKKLATTAGANGAGQINLSTNVKEMISNNIESGTSQPQQNATATTTNVRTARIEADDRLNTIIIRDKANNLKLYQNIIEQLDVPAPLIQIEVMIIRLDQLKLSQKGINWWASSSNNTTIQAVNYNNYVASSYQQINPGQLIITDPGKFSFNLQFLENNSFAQTEAKPSLATTDNIPAIISLTDNIFNGGGNVQNTSGTGASGGIQLTQSLQITPHVIAEKGRKNQIKLAIVLQDGSINETSSSITMPNYFQGYLNSQAVINEGQSIVLAGYTKDSIVNVTNKVPFLGDIPILGWMFKSADKEVHKITTLYLVTPKIVWLNELPAKAESIEVESHNFDFQPNYKLK